MIKLIAKIAIRLGRKLEANVYKKHASGALSDAERDEMLGELKPLLDEAESVLKRYSNTSS